MSRTFGCGVAAFLAVVVAVLSSAPEEAQAGHRRHGCCGAARHRVYRHHRHRARCYGAVQNCQPVATSCCGSAVDYGYDAGAMQGDAGMMQGDEFAPPPPAPDMSVP